jgi:hypothetical protein
MPNRWLPYAKTVKTKSAHPAMDRRISGHGQEYPPLKKSKTADISPQDICGGKNPVLSMLIK